MSQDERLPRGGGGGAWRAFVHKNQVGKFTAASIAVLKARFDALSAAERAELCRIGTLGSRGMCDCKAF